MSECFMQCPIPYSILPLHLCKTNQCPISYRIAVPRIFVVYTCQYLVGFLHSHPHPNIVYTHHHKNSLLPLMRPGSHSVFTRSVHCVLSHTLRVQDVFSRSCSMMWFLAHTPPCLCGEGVLCPGVGHIHALHPVTHAYSHTHTHVRTVTQRERGRATRIRTHTHRHSLITTNTWQTLHNSGITVPLSHHPRRTPVFD
jgi:hypothetical protein